MKVEWCKPVKAGKTNVEMLGEVITVYKKILRNNNEKMVTFDPVLFPGFLHDL